MAETLGHIFHPDLALPKSISVNPWFLLSLFGDNCYRKNICRGQPNVLTGFFSSLCMQCSEDEGKRRRKSNRLLIESTEQRTRQINQRKSEGRSTLPRWSELKGDPRSAKTSSAAATK